MAETTATLNAIRGYLIVEELHRQGVRDVCIAPGSRSTPLALAAAQNDGLRKHVHVDERGLAFFALGLAKGSERPVAIICSSGTATANFHPAMVEAYADRVPLIALTADRPWELHEVGANQSIDQLNIFGTHVRRFTHLPAPAPDEPHEAILGLIDDVVAQATRGNGPIHLNLAFREPFVPESWELPSILKPWNESGAPYVRHVEPQVTLDDEVFKPLAGATRGMIIVGRLNNRRDREAARRIGQSMKWPILADVTSGLRLGYDIPELVPHVDLLSDYPKPDAILYLGGPIVSKAILRVLKCWSEVPLIHVQPAPDRNDPCHRPSTVVDCGLADAEAALPSTAPSELLHSYRSLNDAVDVDAEIASTLGGRVAATVSELIPEGHALFIGNSLSIREFNAVATHTGQRPEVCCNRGASGIDGNVATAVGFATGMNLPLTAVVGDLTALHDVNSLSLLARHPHGVILIVVNNNGGGIFQRLPIAKQTEHFETYFKTPQHVSFKGMAESFGIQYSSPTANELGPIYSEALIDGGRWLIEVNR